MKRQLEELKGGENAPQATPVFAGKRSRHFTAGTPVAGLADYHDERQVRAFDRSYNRALEAWGRWVAWASTGGREIPTRRGAHDADKHKKNARALRPLRAAPPSHTCSALGEAYALCCVCVSNARERVSLRLRGVYVPG